MGQCIATQQQNNSNSLDTNSPASSSFDKKMGNNHSNSHSRSSVQSSSGSKQSTAQHAATAPHIPSPTQTQSQLRTSNNQPNSHVTSTVSPSNAARIAASLPSPSSSPQSASRRLQHGRTRGSGSRQMDPQTAAEIVLHAAGLAHHHHHSSPSTATAHAQYLDDEKPRLGDGVVVGATRHHHTSRRTPSAETLSPVATAIAASIASTAVNNSQLPPLSPRQGPVTVQPQSPDGSTHTRNFLQRMRTRSNSVSRGHRSSSRAEVSSIDHAVQPPFSPTPVQRQLAAVNAQQTRNRSNSIGGPSTSTATPHSSAPLGVSELRQVQSLLSHSPSAPTPSLRTHNKRDITPSNTNSSSHTTSTHHRSHRPAAHIRIDRYTTNELLADKEQTYSPIHEPRNSTVVAMGMLEHDEQLVNGVPISMTRQYSTPPIAPDGHLPPLSSYYPEPDVTVHSVENVHSYDSPGGYTVPMDHHKDTHSMVSPHYNNETSLSKQQRSTSPTYADKTSATMDDSSSSSNDEHSDSNSPQMKGSSHQRTYKSELLQQQQQQQFQPPMQMVIRHG